MVLDRRMEFSDMLGVPMFRLRHDSVALEPIVFMMFSIAPTTTTEVRPGTRRCMTTPNDLMFTNWVVPMQLCLCSDNASACTTCVQLI